MTSFSRIHHLLEHHASHAPDATALVTATTGETSFAQWRDNACQLARKLAANGVRPGHRLMLVAENSCTLACGLMAASLLDAWAIPANARLSSHEIDAINEHAQPAAIVFTSSVSQEAERHALRFKAHEILVGPEQAMLASFNHTTAEPVENGQQDVAVLLYTTGTTGDPKAVMLSHGNLLAAGQMSADHRGILREDHVYGVLPLTHVFGLSSVFMAALSAGARFELVPRFDANATFSALQDKVSIFPAVPQMHA
ncbi:MAG: class I adenylate-forming enzyme family protein, partial [Anderseniella sp.]